MSSLVVAALFAALYVWFRRRDRRLLRLGVFLVAAGWFALIGVTTILSSVVPGFGLLVVLALLLLPVGVLVLAGFLIANGLHMVRAEGRSLANLLSLLAGLALIGLPLVAVGLVSTQNHLALGVAGLLFLLCSYLGVVFGVFLVYSLVYGRTATHQRPVALIVLGSRVIDGRVPPLLRSRLDTALEIYRLTRSRGPAPLLIPSGGKGTDEIGSEGAAMAAYLIEQGADPVDVRPETEARNTEQNLLFSRDVQLAAGRPGPALAVTNNYHVLRTAILARKIGTDTQVVGSPTASYYVPSAFLREFVAVVVEHKVLHLLLLLPFVAATVFFVVALYRQGV